MNLNSKVNIDVNAGLIAQKGVFKIALWTVTIIF